jgi:hypothetical protein
MLLRRAIVLLAACILSANRADAHFLFVRILPPAEGGRFAEVYFSELAEAGDPRFVNKIAGTQLWLQTTPGEFKPLKVRKAADRLRAAVPTSGSVAVVGSCTYGVLARPNQTAFLLRHFPKALAGNADELNRMQANKALPFEIVATFEGDGISFVVLKDGKPIPKAEFVTVDASLKNAKLTADETGKATWKPPAAGLYSVYARNTRKEAGQHDGQKYEEIREFATVAFTWPLERKDADPAAVALFEEAITARAQWRDFPGFTARIAGNLDGRPFAGSITIDAAGDVTYSDDVVDRTESVSRWIEDQLASIVLHRIARPTAPDRPKPVVRFGDTRDDHPLGRLLIFDGGQFASSYRLKDNQLTVVNRHLGKENMTITTLENDRNAEGRFLPRGYVVQYWDADTGRLLRTETVQDRWQRVGSWDLPTTHTVTVAGDSGLSVRSFTLSKHELVTKKSK